MTNSHRLLTVLFTALLTTLTIASPQLSIPTPPIASGSIIESFPLSTLSIEPTASAATVSSSVANNNSIFTIQGPTSTVLSTATVPVASSGSQSQTGSISVTGIPSPSQTTNAGMRNLVGVNGVAVVVAGFVALVL